MTWTPSSKTSIPKRYSSLSTIFFIILSVTDIHSLPISMCGNDNQRLMLNKNSVGQHQLRILTQIDPGFLKTAPQTPVNHHFALKGLLFKLHSIW